MSSPSMDFLAGRSFPDVAAVVRAVIPAIIARWDQALRHVLPKADQLTVDQLRDDMPAVLRGVASALESDRPHATEKLAEISPVHGGVRYEQGFDLNEVLVEYGLLRSCLVQEVVSSLGRDLSCAETMGVGAALDLAVRRTVVRFVETLSRQLQSSSEAQSKYLSFLSHDLRGGLNGVFLMIEVLKRELAHESRLAETVEDLDVMRRSLLETVATMDRFLHAERFRKGKVQVRPAEVNLRNLLSEIAAHFSYQSRDKGIDVRIDAPQDAHILSDKELLTLVFQNLVSNALKYGGKGTEVRIEASFSGDGCTVSVADQGPGIAPEKLDTLFNAFARGETHGQPGVGLGLNIARQAADYLGAKIWAESTLGQGSVFFLQLPPEIKIRA